MIQGDDTLTLEEEELNQKLNSPQPQTQGKGRRFSTAARISSHKLYAASINSKPFDWNSIFTTKEGKAQPMDASALLKRLPRGAYTTCRTIGRGTKVYQFDYHVERLATSAQAMIQSGVVVDGGEVQDYSQVTNLENVRNDVMKSIQSTIQQFRDEFGSEMLSCDEFRITLLSSWLPNEENQESERNVSTTTNANIFNMFCHVTILPYRDTENEHIKVEIHGRGRSNAIAKDSRWVSEREDSSKHNCEEYILVNDDCEMLEGTQTNFYVVVGKNPNTTSEKK